MGREVVAIVPAAGGGSRFGGGNKPFVSLMGKPLLIWALEGLQASGDISEIIPVLKEPDREEGAGLIESTGITKVKRIAAGGAERQDSVLNGLMLVGDPSSTVLIHDGVRPLLEQSLIRETIKALEGHDGAVAALPATDTVKEADAEGVVTRTLDRRGLWAVQTPQVFPFRVIMKAYEAALREGFYSTDDSALVERLGGRVRLVTGSRENIKITTPGDLEVAEAFLGKRGAPG